MVKSENVSQIGHMNLGYLWLSYLGDDSDFEPPEDMKKKKKKRTKSQSSKCHIDSYLYFFFQNVNLDLHLAFIRCLCTPFRAQR